MEEFTPIPPGPEHQRIAESAGTWNVDCTFYMDPSQPAMKTKGTETVTMFGPYFAVSEFECDMGGMPFHGKATIGYDTSKDRWVSTWIDTMMPFLYTFEGELSDDGKLLSFRGEGGSPMGGRCMYRTTEETTDPDTRVFEMFMDAPDGTELKLFTHVYTRAR